MYQRPVEDPLHSPVHIVGKPAHIKPLDVSGQLHQPDHDHVSRRQPEHCREPLRPAQDPHQAARHFSLKPWSRHEPQIVDQSRHRDQRQDLPFRPEIIQDPVRMKFLFIHDDRFLFCHASLLVPSDGLYTGRSVHDNNLLFQNSLLKFSILRDQKSPDSVSFPSFCRSATSLETVSNPARLSFFERKYSLSSVSQNLFLSSSGSSAKSHS